MQPPASAGRTQAFSIRPHINGTRKGIPSATVTTAKGNISMIMAISLDIRGGSGGMIDWHTRMADAYDAPHRCVRFFRAIWEEHITGHCGQPRVPPAAEPGQTGCRPPLFDRLVGAGERRPRAAQTFANSNSSGEARHNSAGCLGPTPTRERDLSRWRRRRGGKFAAGGLATVRHLGNVYEQSKYSCDKIKCTLASQGASLADAGHA